MQEIFSQYKTIIIFLHVISAVIWVGGMVAIYYAAYPSFAEIESPAKRFERVSHALKRFFIIVLPFVIILLITAVFMIKGYALSESDYRVFSLEKEGLWSFMFLNLIYMIKRRSTADKKLQEGDFAQAKKQLDPIIRFMIPLNIILGIIAIFIGSYFSSFL